MENVDILFNVLQVGIVGIVGSFLCEWINKKF